MPSRADQVVGLPKFIVSPSVDYPEWLVVVCPRGDCVSKGMHFMVKRSLWNRRRLAKDGKTVILGRPCAYCGKYSSI